jgi:hypothetical protein
MAGERKTPSGRERTFAHDELIVSKTDPKGRLTYVNDVFLTVSGLNRPGIAGGWFDQIYAATGMSSSMA